MMVHRNAAMKKPPRKPARQPEPVTSDQVDPLAMDTAKELLHGFYGRQIRIGGVREVLVLNFPGQRFGKVRPIARGR